MTPAEPQQSRPRTYSKHGLSRLKDAMRTLGNRAIDRRTKAGRALELWRRELLADLGGADQVSVQRAGLVDLAVRAKLMLDSVDAWILEHGRVVDGRKRCLLPVVRERTALAMHFQSLMKDLGLDRRARQVPSLSAYLARQHEQAALAAPVATPMATPTPAPATPVAMAEVDAPPAAAIVDPRAYGETSPDVSDDHDEPEAA
jgi:hypothetical protein